MIKQKHLALTLELFFKKNKFLFILFTFLFHLQIFNSFSQEETNKKQSNSKIVNNFPIVVIDMKFVLSKATSWKTLQSEVKKLEENFKKAIAKEEGDLKKDQKSLVAQKAVISEEEFKEKENVFRGKVKKTQTKIENIRRELESTMAKGMQVIQAEAVKHLKQIAAEEGYLLVLDAASTVIAADKINISELVAEKLNKTLPEIKIERKKDKKDN